MWKRRCTACGREHVNLPGIFFLGNCSECGKEACVACGTLLHAVVHHECWRTIARHIDEDDLMRELLSSLPK